MNRKGKMKYKRFINNEEFSKKIQEYRFNNIINERFHTFDENGISTLCQCCGKGEVFIKLNYPEDRQEFINAKFRMNKYLEKHIQEEIKKRSEKFLKEVEEQVRKEFQKLS